MEEINRTYKGQISKNICLCYQNTMIRMLESYLRIKSRIKNYRSLTKDCQ